MKIITRFAPSPTGFLHIGGARTALFNYLYAKSLGGSFLLRIEDTDRKRSTSTAVEAIIQGLFWLGLKNDGKIIFQSENIKRHVAIAKELISKGKAYSSSGDFVVRIKTSDDGYTLIKDKVYGEMRVANDTIEDFVILRSDGTPTYMLSVVVDDYDAGITHVIRGADHITNTAKQILIYNALNWRQPEFVHIPLIHGGSGAKMSKRDGALGIEEYQKMGFLPEALRNYLLRLGWGSGDEEIINDERAQKLFNLEGIGKSPARFDIQKLQYINNLCLRAREDVLEELKPFLGVVSLEKKSILAKAIPILTEKAKTLVELAQYAKMFILDKVTLDQEATNVLNKEIIPELLASLGCVEQWNKEEIMFVITKLSGEYKKKDIYQTLRAALTGSMNSPAIIIVILALGKKITLGRLRNILE